MSFFFTLLAFSLFAVCSGINCKVGYMSTIHFDPIFKAEMKQCNGDKQEHRCFSAVCTTASTPHGRAIVWGCLADADMRICKTGSDNIYLAEKLASNLDLVDHMPDLLCGQCQSSAYGEEMGNKADRFRDAETERHWHVSMNSPR
uniref:Secreted protein n=1 Tax=Globodera rostochiensis TaxID=31243 RepID=A0A914HVQ4_GLORO